MKLKKTMIGLGLISMSMGMIGCGMENDNITSKATVPSNYPTQVRMDIKDNSDTMKINGKYSTTNRGRVLQPKNTTNYAQYPNISKMNGNYGSSNGVQYGMNNENERNISKMEKIQKEISKVTGYDNVSCVVDGNTAIVGCTAKNGNVSETQLKDEVKNIVKRCDPSITRCEVINNKDGITKIGRMAEDMRKGNIGMTISRDFQKMLNDIIR